MNDIIPLNIPRQLAAQLPEALDAACRHSGSRFAHLAAFLMEELQRSSITLNKDAVRAELEAEAKAKAEAEAKAKADAEKKPDAPLASGPLPPPAADPNAPKKTELAKAVGDALKG